MSIQKALENHLKMNLYQILSQLDHLSEKQLKILYKVLRFDDFTFGSNKTKKTLLRTLLSDLRLVESITDINFSLTKPVALMHGQYDDRVTEKEMLSWSEICHIRPSLKKYQGDHFFVNDRKIAVELVNDIGKFIYEIENEQSKKYV